MTTPLFFREDNRYYNINEIVNFKVVGSDYHITMSNGDFVVLSKEALKLEEVIHIVNAPAQNPH